MNCGTIVPALPDLDRLRQLEFEFGKGIAGWVASHREAVRVDDTASDLELASMLGRELGAAFENFGLLTDEKGGYAGMTVLFQDITSYS